MRHKVRTSSVIVVVFVLLLTAIGCQRDPVKKAQDYYDQGQTLAKDGKVNDAILMYRRAVQTNPKMYPARLALADLLLGRGDALGAYRELLNVLKADPKNYDARLRKAQFLTSARQAPEALKEVEALLAERPNDVEAKLVRAQNQFATNDIAAATETLNDILKSDPRQPKALYLRAILEAQQKRLDEADATLKTVIEVKPDWPLPVTTRAGLMISRNDVAGAEAMIREAVQKNKNALAMSDVLVMFLQQQKRFPELEAQLKLVKATADADPAHRVQLAQFYLTQNKVDLAETELKDVVGRHADDDTARQMLAQTYLSRGKQADGEREIAEVLKRHPGQGQALLLRGLLRTQQGRFEDALVDLQTAVQAMPQNGLAHFHLAQAYLRQGKVSQAKDELRSTLSNEPGFATARILLAELELKTGEPDRALADSEAMLKGAPKASVYPYWLKSSALAAKGDWTKAEQEMTPLLQQFPQEGNQAFVYRSLATLKLAQGKAAEARTLIQKSMAADATSADSLLILGRTYLLEKKPDAGIAAVQQMLAKNPNWASGYDALGQLQRMARRLPEAEASFQKAISIDGNRPGTKMQLAGVYAEQAKWDAAIGLVKDLSKADPKDTSPYMMLAQIYDSRGDTNSAVSTYQEVLKLTPENILAKNNLAYLYAEHGGNIDLGLKYAEEARQAAPDSPAVADTLAWIYCKKQAYGNAIQLLEESTKKEPENALYLYHLGYAYSKQGMKTEARTTLLKALKVQPTFPNAKDAKQLLDTID